MSLKVLKLVVPVVVLVAGVAAAALIASSRKAPPREARPALGPLVEVMPAQVTDVSVTVSGHGEVVAKVAVDVVPQVAGQAVEVHPALVAGGFFRAGQTLVVIDPRDYQLAVERAQASVARARVTLQREEAEAEVARQEWDELHPGEEPTSGLVVREPQIRQAEAELAAAMADLEYAKLNLERTRLSLPFDGVVVSESVDVGQFVGTSGPVARVYGTDVVEVRVPLDSRELAWFTVPVGRDNKGPRVELSARYGGRRHKWDGRLTRMEAEVDQSSRMVNVVVEVADPYEVVDERPALLPGTFVDVQISGRTLEQVVAVPRHAMRDGNRVWVYRDGALRIIEVEVLRSDRQQSLIAAGLDDGDLVVVSSLDAVTDGMTVRISNGDPSGEERGSESDEAGDDEVAALDPVPGPSPCSALASTQSAVRSRQVVRGSA
jgi:RND family efflux transporter MFP subunit